MIQFIKKFMKSELFAYGIFGVLTTIINYIVYELFLFSGSIVLANTIAFIVAVLFAFVVNKRYVFKSMDYSRKTVLKEFNIFVAGRIFSFLFETVALVIMVNTFGLDKHYSKIFLNIIVIILNYLLSKFIIFKRKPNA